MNNTKEIRNVEILYFCFYKATYNLDIQTNNIIGNNFYYLDNLLIVTYLTFDLPPNSTHMLKKGVV